LTFTLGTGTIALAGLARHPSTEGAVGQTVRARLTAGLQIPHARQSQLTIWAPNLRLETKKELKVRYLI
jgi:hypothetical protein